MAGASLFKASCCFALLVLVANLFHVGAQTPTPSREEKIAAATKLLEEAGHLMASPAIASKLAAVEKIETAEKLYEDAGDREDLAAAYSLHGSVLLMMGRNDAAIEMVNRSLAIFKSLDHSVGQASDLLILGSHYYKQRELARAAEVLEEARIQIEKQPYQSLDLQIYQLLGSIYVDLGDRKKALDVLWRSYEVAKERTPAETIAMIQNYANAQVKLGTPKLAPQFFEIALQRAKASNLTSLEVGILNDLGSLYINQIENPAKGQQYLEEALAKIDATPDVIVKTHVLYNLGYCAYISFRMPEALAFYDRARVIAETNRLRSYEANIANNTALVYAALGDPKRAIPYFEHSVKTARDAGEKETELHALTGLANIQAASGDPQAAAMNYTAAVALGTELVKKGVPPLSLRTFAMRLLIDFGNFAIKAGQTDLAMEIYSAAVLKAREWEQRGNESTLTNNIGKVHELRGEYVKALTMYNSSLAIAREVGAYSEAVTLDNLMSVWAKLGNRNFAVFYGKNAVNMFQGYRRGLHGLGVDEQKGFLKVIEGTYRRLAAILIEQGRVAEAEQVLTMLKEEEVIDYVRRDDDVAKAMLATMTLTDDERSALTRYEAVAGQITALGKEFSDLESERLGFPSGQLFPKQSRYDELKKQLADATTTFEKFLDELKTRFGKNDVRVVQVDSSLKKTLDRLKADHTAVVSTIVGEDTLNIIVTTRKTQRAHTIKKSAKEINELVTTLHMALRSPQYDPRPASQILYDILVKPIEGDLAGIKADTIIWSLDGTLRYIPPAALWDKQNGYLAERFSNVIVNLASRDTLAMQVPSGQKLSVLGVGVSKAVESFSALAAVPDELDCIVSDSIVGMLSRKPQCTGGVLSGRKLLDETFTLANFENELGRYPIIHIASHFKLTPGDDKNSFLLLGGGDDRKFTVEKLRSEPLTDVELVVLSACNTATPGGSRTNGVEIEGFGSIAQKEGAKSVLASLWAVADSSTKDFMVEFYRLYGREGKSKADAMRLAQLKLLNGKYAPAEAEKKRRSDEFTTAPNTSMPAFTPDPNAPFAHPFYWSPFILMGNWR